MFVFLIFYAIILIMEKQKKSSYCNLPNALSLFRLLCVPVFLLVFFLLSPNYIFAFAVFIVASITDILDGIIARRFNQITPLGMVLDPLADKLLKMSALFAFGWDGIIDWWLVAVLFAIDLTMIIAGTILFKRQITIPSNIIGKTGTFVMSVGLMMCFFPYVFASWNGYILYIGLGIITSSVIMYVALNFKSVMAELRIIKQKNKTEKLSKQKAGNGRAVVQTAEFTETDSSSMKKEKR